VAGPLRVYPRAPADHRPHSIAAVSPGGPADKAGITAGSVVTRVDDRVIPNGNSLVAPNGNSLGLWHTFRGADVARVASGIGVIWVIMVGM